MEARAMRLTEESNRGKLRLNLGAGDKKLQGYVGVDLHPGADVQCDILELPQAWEGKCEEVLVVHALEHIAFYDTDRALLEWKRALAPGGKLVIECPNLLEACKSYLQNPDDHPRGLWVFYGDQARGDILTVHKSGWTPKTLIQAMERVGFSDCAQKPAQFKKREPRDFRVEGIK